MPLADILSAMEQEVAAEIRRVEEQTAASVAEMRASAERDAQAIRERHRREMLPLLQHERARRLNRARLDSLRASSSAREQLFTQALGCAQERLAQLRSDPGYADILRALVQEALAQLDGAVIVRADPRDEKILHTLLEGMPIEFDLETWGGIEARTLDGRIRVVNTLEARLEQAEVVLRQSIMPLFESQLADSSANSELVQGSC
ncbi:MAG: hypothetical protein HY741_16280 [Chloroflexi bacterium]|nr:hypothetical protein [Chloroflexota bacterium]